MGTTKPSWCKSTENIPHLLENGDVIWQSRSIATAILVIKGKDVLLVKRGQAMDNAGKYCMPCGYLDYNETCKEGALRELWEETNLIKDEAHYGDLYRRMQFDYFLDDINQNRQNVVMLYWLSVYGDYDHVSNINVGEDEVESVQWVPIKDIMKMDKSDFAFDHKNQIHRLYYSWLETIKSLNK